MASELEKILTMKKRLNSVSASFCAAKWLQGSTYLHLGETHSCHYNPRHKIPLLEVSTNPSAIHDTQTKKLERKEMLQGKRPSGCEFCWKIEDSSASAISDRHWKSSQAWAEPYIENLAALPDDSPVVPTYLEVSFSRTCNFKCSYCSPEFSSSWQKEISAFGSYQDRPEMVAFLDDTLQEENNPYVNAFWKWWPELKRSLRVFRITGGEPLLSQSTFRVLESLIADPVPELELAINSNLGVPRDRVDKLISHVKLLLSKKCISSFSLFTSLEGWGRQAEYMRFGMNFRAFWENLNLVLSELPEIQVTIMCTFNALSVPTFGRLVKEVGILRKNFTGNRVRSPLVLNISHLRDPALQSVQVLPLSYQENVQEIVALMQTYSDRNFQYGYSPLEIANMQRIVAFMKENSKSPEEIYDLRVSFRRFFGEYDRRRGTCFLETFPELEELWNEFSFEEASRSNFLNFRTFLEDQDWKKWEINGPTALEIGFSKECNLKCSHCSSHFSSAWQEELVEFGPYVDRPEMPMTQKKGLDSEYYVSMFWERWPSLRKSLRDFRITGGEPLLSKETFRILENLADDPVPDLKLSIESHLGVSEEILDRFVELAKKLVSGKKIQSLSISTGLEAWGLQAEYTRFGLDFDRFFQNLQTLLVQLPQVPIRIKCAVHVLSLFSLGRLVREIGDLRKKHPDGRLFLDIFYVSKPSFQSIQILPWRYLNYLTEALTVMQDYSIRKIPSGYTSGEIKNLENVIFYMKRTEGTEKELIELRVSFLRFFKEWDRRKRLNLLTAFPELRETLELFEFQIACHEKRESLAGVELEKLNFLVDESDCSFPLTSRVAQRQSAERITLYSYLHTPRSQVENLRKDLDFASQWEKMDGFLEKKTKVQLIIKTYLCLLNIAVFARFVKDVGVLRKKHGISRSFSPIVIDIAVGPSIEVMAGLPSKCWTYLADILASMNLYSFEKFENGFSAEEISKVEEIIDAVQKQSFLKKASV